jgi:hypothetical protein
MGAVATHMCYVQFKIDFELSLTLTYGLGLQFKINNFELHYTHMCYVLNHQENKF